eukprot:TRINITY_DN3171_c0_g1_i1.p1 TRINITY_DN3171_c0_g1~~TRINITY_DN3171_c0_g1_i1.p1  ORF type:complete len:345 (+),score=92.59 TRINITY_DN3171_c0_g1_i1:479-1513(+)
MNETMDLALVAMFKKSYAVEFYPHPGYAISESQGSSVSPYGDAYVLSVGYVIVLLMTVPLGYFNLDDNIIVQNGAFIFMIIIFLEWFVNFFIVGLESKRTPAVGASFDQVFGNVIFNYAFVITVPSWVNEKRASVPINASLWTATSIATLFYLSVGLFGAWAFDYGPNQDLLDAININSHGVAHDIARVFVYLFPIVALLSSIPVFSIIIRYNLVENNICRKPWANFWAVVFPWILSVVFYAGAGLLSLINWASLLVNGTVNFAIPLLLYILSTRVTHHPVIEANIQVDEEDTSEEPDSADFRILPSWLPIPEITCGVGLLSLFIFFLLGIIGINIAVAAGANF